MNQEVRIKNDTCLPDSCMGVGFVVMWLFEKRGEEENQERVRGLFLIRKRITRKTKPGEGEEFSLIRKRIMQETKPREGGRRRGQTLKRKCMMSPSWTMYSFPSTLILPAVLTAESLPRVT